MKCSKFHSFIWWSSRNWRNSCSDRIGIFKVLAIVNFDPGSFPDTRKLVFLLTEFDVCPPNFSIIFLAFILVILFKRPVITNVRFSNSNDFSFFKLFSEFIPKDCRLLINFRFSSTLNHRKKIVPVISPIPLMFVNSSRGADVISEKLLNLFATHFAVSIPIFGMPKANINLKKSLFFDQAASSHLWLVLSHFFETILVFP